MNKYTIPMPIGVRAEILESSFGSKQSLSLGDIKGRSLRIEDFMPVKSEVSADGITAEYIWKVSEDGLQMCLLGNAHVYLLDLKKFAIIGSDPLIFTNLSLDVAGVEIINNGFIYYSTKKIGKFHLDGRSESVIVDGLITSVCIEGEKSHFKIFNPESETTSRGEL